MSDSIQHSRWGETRWVRFTPQRVDDLKPHAEAWIGREFEVSFQGTMDEGDYQGQSMWMPVDRDVMDGLVTWLPDCDLTDVTPDKFRVTAKVKDRPATPKTPSAGTTDGLIAKSEGWSLTVDRAKMRSGVTYRAQAAIRPDGSRHVSLIADDGEDLSDALTFAYDRG